MERFLFLVTAIVALQCSACPFALAQWKQVYGSYGGSTHMVVQASGDSAPNTQLFAGTDYGPFISNDSGVSWYPVNQGMPTLVRAMASNNLGTYLIRVGLEPWTSSDSLGVVYTTDRGVNWLPIDSTWNIPDMYALAGCGNNLYVGRDSGLMITGDNGQTWRRCDSIGAQYLTVQVAPSGDTTILALTTSIMGSSDNGVTWTTALPGGIVFLPPRTYIDRPLQGLAACDSFAVVGSNGNVYLSTDRGKTWSQSHPLPDPAGSLDVTAVGVDDANVYASTGPNLFRSPDRGITWTSVSDRLPKGNYFNEQLIHSLSTVGHALFATTVAGIFVSHDHGNTWVAQNNGLDAGAPASLAASDSVVYATLGSGYFLGRSTDRGDDWTVLNDAALYRFRSLAASGPHIVAGTDAPSLQNGYSPAWRSSDYGASWTTDTAAVQAFTAHEYAMNDTYVFAGMVYGAMGMSRCHVDSSRWMPLSGLNGISVEGIDASGSTLLVGSFSQGIFLSSDNGEHWAPISNGFDFTEEAFNTSAMAASTIFAGTSQQVPPGAPLLRKGGVWCSTDGGATWENRNLSGYNIMGLVIAGANVIAATDSAGVFISSNNGERWWPLNDGLPSRMISSLIASDDYLFAGALGGIYRLPLSEAITSVAPDESAVPSHDVLEQNYPNPFNPITTIKYTVAGTSGLSGSAHCGAATLGPAGAGPEVLGASNVELAVYDILGREVAILVNEVKRPGTYAVEFDGSGLSSGIYFYRMTAGKVILTRKLVLLK
jgi:photosystem II stability/assembly factor-like uncharacterized protein